MAPAPSHSCHRLLLAATLLASTFPAAPTRAQGDTIDIAPVEVTAKKQKPVAKRPARQAAAKPARPSLRAAERRLVSAAARAPAPAAIPPAAGPRPTSTQTTSTTNGGEGTPPGTAPAFAGGQVASGGRVGILGNTDVKKTPFTITSYTDKFIRDRQAPTITQALALDPAVRAEQSRGGTVDAFTIRGFPFNEGNVGEFAFAGVYGVAPNSRIFTDYAERIEVLEGPSATISGVAPNGAIGGVINIVPKLAGNDLTRVTMSIDSIDYAGLQLDIARRYGRQREWGVRFVGAGYGGHANVERQYERTGIGYLGLDYQGDRARSFLYLLSQDDRYNAPSRPFLASAGVGPVPAAPSGTLNISQPWEYSRQYDNSALFRQEIDILPNVTVFGDLGGASGRVNRFFGNPTITTSAGTFTNTPGFFDQSVRRYSYDGGLRAGFDTGVVHHAFVLQQSVYHDEVTRQLNSARAYTSNIYDPALQPVQFPNTLGPRAPLAADKLAGFTLVDTLSVLRERVLLTVGVRRQEVDTSNFRSNVGTLSSYVDAYAITPLVGLVLRPTENVSLYGNFTEGLTRGDAAPVQATNSGTVLPPYLSTQYEVGAKGQFGGLGTALALFQISKANGELNPSTLLFSATGEQRVRGIEFKTYGELRPGVRVLGGVTYLAGTLTRTATLANVGNNPIGVPHVQLNIGGEYDLPFIRGGTVVGAVIHTGRQFVDLANRQPISDWTRLDLGTRYVTLVDGRRTTFRFNVENVTGTDYYTGVASFGTFFVGSPRTYFGSISVDL